MERMLNSAMVQEELDKRIARKNEIADLVEERKATFENADIETRDSLLNEVEELTKEAETLEEEINGLKEQKETLEEQEKRMSMAKSLSKEVIEERKAEMEEKNIFDTKEYNQLYADMIRGKTDEREVRSYIERSGSANLSTSTSYVPIPVIMQGFVETAWYEYGKFSRLVSESFEPGIFKIPVESSASAANWHTENGDAVSQEEITLAQIVLQPKMIKKFIALTDELMAMAADEFLRYVADELVYQIILALDEAIINRTDVGGLGVIGVAGNTNTTSYTAGIDFNVINKAIATLVTFDDLTIAMNPATFFNNFMGLTDQVGRPIYQIAADNTGKPQYFLNGYRVEFTNALPAYDSANAAAVYAVVGNFRRGYRLNYPQGRDVITLVDPYTLATEDVVRMIGRLYVAGNVVKPHHFAQLVKPASV